MSETEAIDEWLNALLDADATLVSYVGTRIYAALAPPETTLPCVVFGLMQPTADVRAANGKRVTVRPVYEVKAVGNPLDMLALKPIANRLDALLQGTVTDATDIVFRCYRQSPLEKPDVLLGTTRFAHLGGQYEIVCSPKF